LHRCIVNLSKIDLKAIKKIDVVVLVIASNVSSRGENKMNDVAILIIILKLCHPECNEGSRFITGFFALLRMTEGVFAMTERLCHPECNEGSRFINYSIPRFFALLRMTKWALEMTEGVCYLEQRERSYRIIRRFLIVPAGLVIRNDRGCVVLNEMKHIVAGFFALLRMTEGVVRKITGFIYKKIPQLVWD